MGTQYKITCPGCSKSLKVNLKPEARKAKCPACQAVVRIPAMPRAEPKELTPPKPVEEPETDCENSTGDEACEQDWNYGDADYGDSEYGEAGYGEAGYGEAGYGDDEERVFDNPALPPKSGSKRTARAGAAANTAKSVAMAKSSDSRQLSRGVKLLIGFAVFTFVACAVGGVVLLSGGDDSVAGGDSDSDANIVSVENDTDSSGSETEARGLSDAGDQDFDVEAATLEYARNKAAAVEEIRTIHEWNTEVIDGSEVWDLVADPGPSIDSEKMTELSTKFPGISITGFQPASATINSNGSNTPILFDYESMKGKRLSGSLAKIPAREEDGYRWHTVGRATPQ